MALPGMGPEVGDAYIEVHADTKKFRAQLQQRLAKEMVAYAKKAQKTFGDYLSMDQAADWETFHRNLAQAARSGDFDRLRRQFKDTGDWVGEIAKRLDALKDTWIEVRDENDKVESRRKLFKVEEIDRIRKALGLYVQELQEANNQVAARAFRKLAARYEEDYEKFTKAQRAKRLQVEKFYTDLANNYERDYEQQQAAQRKQNISIAEFFRRLGRHYDADYQRHKAAEERKQETRDRMTRLHATALRQQTAMEQDAAAEILAARRRITDEILFQARTSTFNADQMTDQRKKIQAELERATEDHRRELGVRQGDWDRYITHLRTTLVSFRTLEERARRQAKSAEDAALRRSQEKYSVFFDGMRRSRSELIHGVAVLMDWISTGIGRSFDALINGVKTFVGYFKPGGGGFGKMFTDIGTAVAGLARNWQAILITIGAIASTLALMAATLGVVVSLASGLLGIITGVVSSLGMAVTSLVPLAGVLTGLGLGAGLLIAAFKDMDRYLPGVSDALKELRRVFSDVDVPAFAAGVRGPLRDLFTSLASSLEGDKVAGALGRAFGGIIGSLEAVVKSAGWKAFMGALETTIPSAIEKFGSGFGGVLQGIMSSFAAGGPAVEKMGAAFEAFGVNFAKRMDEMDKTGRLDKFFDLAADSMIVVSDLAFSLGEALVGLFEAAAPAGNDMLRSLTGLVKRFTEWVTSAEGQNQIAEWMQHARDVADKVWDILKEVGAQMKRLDTPENRRWALSVLNLIRGIVVGVGNVISLAGQLAEAYETVNQTIIGVFQGIGTWLGEVWQSIMDGWNGFLTAWNEFWGGVDWGTLGSDIMQGFMDGLTSAASGAANWIKDLFRPYIDAVKELFGVASPSTVFAQIGRDVIAGFKQGIQDAWGSFVTWVTGLFSGLMDSLTKSWDTLRKNTSTAWDKITGVVRDKVEEIRTNLSAKWDAIRTTVGEKVDSIRTAISTKWSEIRTTVASRVEQVRADIAAKWESIRSNASSKWSEVRSAISSAWDSIRSAVSGKIGEVVSTVGGLPSRAVKALGKVGSTLWSAGRSLVQGFLNGMDSRIGAVVATAASMASKAAYAVQKRLLIKSPSKVFERLGMFTAEGFEQGLLRRQARVEAALVRMVAPPNLNPLAPGDNVLGARAFAGARTINVAPGAIQISTRATDPRHAANMVLDGMASHMMGV